MIASCFLHLWLEIVFDDCRRQHGRVHEAAVGEAVECNNWVLALLARFDVENLMQISFGASGHPEQAVFRPLEGQSWRCKIEVSGAIWVNMSIVSKQNTTHQHHTFDGHSLAGLVSIMSTDIKLGHHPTKRMRCHKHVITSKAMLPQVFECLADVVTNKNRLWSIKHELWEPNPKFHIVGRSHLLDLSCNLSVSLRFALHSVDPDNGDWGTVGATWWL